MNSATKEKPIYLYPLAALFSASLMLLIFGGLGVIWVRMEIRATAERTSALEQELRETRVQLQAVDARIAAFHSPDNLKTEIARHQLPLLPPVQTQLVVLHERSRTLDNPMAPVAQPMIASQSKNPLTRSLNLALLETARGQ